MNRIVVSIAAGVTTVLVVFAGGYGYHRDELYFLAAGRHLAWAYADQGPFTPLVARAMSEIAPDSLTVLRIPSALAAGATVYAYGDWGPPPNGSAPVVAVGLPLADLARLRGSASSRESTTASAPTTTSRARTSTSAAAPCAHGRRSGRPSATWAEPAEPCPSANPWTDDRGDRAAGDTEADPR